MKRIITLMMALALVFGAVANSSAADIKAKGTFQMGYQWTDNTNFSDGDSTSGDGTSEDDFVAQQRFRTQIDITASENLKGVVYFEIDQVWGRSDAKAGSNAGGALGADGVNVETRRAYIDWTVPNTAMSVRMGIQGLALPAVAAGSSILDTDVAAIVTTYKFNDMFSLNAFWARPYDTQQVDTVGTDSNKEDELDLFGLIAGVKLDGMEFTPYAVYGSIGADTTANTGLQSMLSLAGIPSAGSTNVNATNWGTVTQGAPGPQTYALGFNGTGEIESSQAYWLGLGFKLDMFDPVVLKLDAVYGKVDNNDFEYNLAGYNATTGLVNATGSITETDSDILDRSGWAVTAKLSYKMDMVTPAIFAWYASGEDDDITNGSERLPVLNTGNAFNPTSFGTDGAAAGFASQDLLGTSNDGKWGLGLFLEDIKVIDNLTSQFRVLYVEGTNDADVLNGMVNLTGVTKATFLKNNVGAFMTDEDHAWEVNFDHKYDIYENLAMYVEMGYVNLDLDNSAWGITSTSRSYDEDAYKLGFVFTYSF